jgi:tRNA dimethylallyltransferase
LAYFERLANENPQTLQNPQRMMRFVEVCIGTGKPFLVLNQKQNERGFTPIIIGLEAERSVMYTRINQRRYYDAAWPINRSQGLTCQ